MNSKFKFNRPRTPVNNNWMLSFADLLSLILTFFVLIFATSSIPKKNWDKYKNEFMVLSRSSHIGFLTYISKSSEVDSVNIKKVIKPNFDVDYIKKLIIKSLDEDLLFSGDVIIEANPNNVLIVFRRKNLISEENGEFELTEKGKRALYQLSPALSSLNNQINLAYRGSDQKYNMKILNFFGDKILDVGYKKNIRKIFSAINYNFSYRDRLVLIIKNYEATL